MYESRYQKEIQEAYEAGYRKGLKEQRRSLNEESPYNPPPKHGIPTRNAPPTRGGGGGTARASGPRDPADLDALSPRIKEILDLLPDCHSFDCPRLVKELRFYYDELCRLGWPAYCGLAIPGE